MIANGARRAEDFATGRMVERWAAALAGPIADGYRRWRETSRVDRLMQLPGRVLQHRLAARATDRHRRHGYRIVSDRTT